MHPKLHRIAKKLSSKLKEKYIRSFTTFYKSILQRQHTILYSLKMKDLTFHDAQETFILYEHN